MELKRILDSKITPNTYREYVEYPYMEKEYQYCLRCGRKLKNAEYRKIGMGKVCQEKSKHSIIIQPLFNSKNADSKNKPDTK